MLASHRGGKQWRWIIRTPKFNAWFTWKRHCIFGTPEIIFCLLFCRFVHWTMWRYSPEKSIALQKWFFGRLAFPFRMFAFFRVYDMLNFGGLKIKIDRTSEKIISNRTHWTDCQVDDDTLTPWCEKKKGRPARTLRSERVGGRNAWFENIQRCIWEWWEDHRIFLKCGLL